MKEKQKKKKGQNSTKQGTKELCDAPGSRFHELRGGTLFTSNTTSGDKDFPSFFETNSSVS
jgi:hypothetical protein